MLRGVIKSLPLSLEAYRLSSGMIAALRGSKKRAEAVKAMSTLQRCSGDPETDLSATMIIARSTARMNAFFYANLLNARVGDAHRHVRPCPLNYSSGPIGRSKPYWGKPLAGIGNKGHGRYGSTQPA